MRHQILDESVKLNLEDGICLVFLKVQNLLTCLIEHHRGDARVVLHKKGQVFESILIRIKGFQGMIEAIRMLEQLHLFSVTFGP